MAITDGPPYVKLRHGALPLSDGDSDNLRDRDGNPDPDGRVDTDEDTYAPDSHTFPDPDDRLVLDLGKGASRVQAQALSRLVMRNFSAARAGDGAAVCALMSPLAAAGVTRDTSLPRGESCAAATSTLLRRMRRRLAAPIRIVDVRMVGPGASVIFGSKTMPASEVLLLRRGHGWEFAELVGHTLL